MLIDIKNKPIYLHFLDRELRRAENINFSDNDILEFTIIAVISSLSYCYIGASILFESNKIFPISTSLITNLEKLDFIKIVTNEHSLEEFLTTRKRIYSHASERYPMYFDYDIEKLWPYSPAISNGSTTSILRINFLEYLDGSSDEIIAKSNFQRGILKKLEKKLYSERGKAITLDLFLTQNQLKNPIMRRTLGRLVSFFYTKRYLDLFHGDLLCNLPGLTFYDKLSSDSFYNNSFIIKAILKNIFIPDYFFRNRKFDKVFFIQFITSKMFRFFQIELFSFVSGLKNIFENQFNKNIYIFQKYIDSLFIQPNIKDNLDPENFLSIIYSNLYKTISKISNQNLFFLNSYKMTKKTLTNNKKTLIVTTTRIETQKVIEVLIRAGKKPSPFSIEKLTFWNFGIIGNSEISLLKLSDMGSLKPSGSELSIYDAIKLFRPDFVIMVGIAFGLKRSKQKIGDILVSRELQNYDSRKKTNTEIIPRGPRIPAGSTLLDRFDNSSLIFNKADVKIDFMISGDTLVDDKDFVEELQRVFPEAVGGEMEGTGLQASCHRSKIEWILIKGICDWGYDKQGQDKDKNQEIAITNASNYLVYTLSKFEF